jgi:isopentenyl diphosphate isomerase/L-lactate dehydrogenase-like FMN-dependent dehydrogenase
LTRRRARERTANAGDQVCEGRRRGRQADGALRLDAVLQPRRDCVQVKRQLLVDGGLDRGQDDGNPIEFGVSHRHLGRVVGVSVAFVQQLIGRSFQFVSNVG